MKRKTLLAVVIVAMVSTRVLAGGLLTNSNQNAAFLRSMAQDGTIDINSIYANPAGGAFLTDGWHLALNMQSAFQQRNITTKFPYFTQNADNPYDTHEFKGKATAPVIPSVTVSYNKPKWSVSAHFALGGGGGKCEFDDGLGSFESTYAGMMALQVPSVLPTMVSPALVAMGRPESMAQAMASGTTYDGYTLDSYMKGRSYYFGLQVGATYKFLDNLSGYIGLRGVYATCNYKGYVHPTVYYSIPSVTSGSAELSSYGIDMDCDQTGFGVTPIIGIDWRVNKHWNLAAKYEAPTKMNLKNSTDMEAEDMVVEAAADVLGQFKDGEKVREDVPGILTLGAQYSPIEKVRLSAGFHEYFDKSAKKYADKQKLIDHNTWELNAAVEWDICRFVTASASWQTTQYGLGDEYMNDLSFNLSNHMVGFGVRVRPCRMLSIDLAYMHTIYGSRDVATETKSDHYVRKNDVVGIGFNFDF